MKVVSFTLEFWRGVNSVGHDSGNGFLHILHPFGHLGVAHLIDLFNELVIFLPERHLGCFSLGLVLKRKRNILLYKNIIMAAVMYCILLCTIFAILCRSCKNFCFEVLWMKKTCNKIQLLLYWTCQVCIYILRSLDNSLYYSPKM